MKDSVKRILNHPPPAKPIAVNNVPELGMCITYLYFVCYVQGNNES